MLDLSGNELFDGFVDFCYQLLNQLTVCVILLFLIQLCYSFDLSRTHLRYAQIHFETAANDDPQTGFMISSKARDLHQQNSISPPG